MKPTTEAAPQRGPTTRVERSSTVLGARVTHRNAPERIGVILSEVNGQCVVEYTHAPEAGEPFTTLASYPLADLTIV